MSTYDKIWLLDVVAKSPMSQVLPEIPSAFAIICLSFSVYIDKGGRLEIRLGLY